jgi:hypothetical protein
MKPVNSFNIFLIVKYNLWHNLQLVDGGQLWNNSWKPYVYIVFTTGRPLCHEVLPMILNIENLNIYFFSIAEKMKGTRRYYTCAYKYNNTSWYLREINHQYVVLLVR